MTRALIAACAVGILAIVLESDGRASLYHPEDRTGQVQVDEKGRPEPYPFDELARRRLILRNVGNPSWPLHEVNPQTKEVVRDPKTGQPKLSDRGEVDARVKKALRKPAEARTEVESVALAVDLLRLGQPEQAEEALRLQRSGYLANATLAHVAAAQGQWARAFDYLDIANGERAPGKLPGTSPEQLAWNRKLDEGALKKLLRLRWDEAKGAKPSPEAEQPDDLFGVKFVNDAGAYEPGKLAASEKAKLPGGDFTEAIATVQQLVLWFPFDMRLYWLLGELYAAKGEFDAAKKVMDECVDTGRYSNRKVLMEHREAVAKAAADAAAAAAKAAEVPPEPEPPISMRTILLYFAGVGAIAVFALVRAIMRRRLTENDCGPTLG